MPPIEASDIPVSEVPQKGRALVVDDHEDSARSLELMLKALGYEADVAKDGIDALRKAADFRPDLFLLDISMPKLDGYDTCGVIRAQPWAGNVRLIAVTGWDPEELKRRSKTAGFDDYLIKPVDFDALKRILESSSRASDSLSE